MDRHGVNWIVDTEVVQHFSRAEVHEASKDSDDESGPVLDAIAGSAMSMWIQYPVTATSPAKLPLQIITKLNWFFVPRFR
jgi:hypothetical protein